MFYHCLSPSSDLFETFALPSRQIANKLRIRCFFNRTACIINRAREDQLIHNDSTTNICEVMILEQCR